MCHLGSVHTGNKVEFNTVDFVNRSTMLNVQFCCRFVRQRLEYLWVTWVPIFLYGSVCWAISKMDARKIDALDQWCLRMLLGIKWYQFSLPSGRLEKTTRSSPHHVAQHRPRGSETTSPYAPRSSRFSSEPPSVEDDVDVWRYAILRPVYSDATQLNSTSSWVELCRYKRAFRVACQKRRWLWSSH